ncbi:centromere protein B, putative, partial [Ixodes scapularis]
MLPDRTLCFNGESCSGGKFSKERITVMIGTNAMGTEKLPLLLIVIGKTKDSGSFHDPEHLSVWYSSNTKAWITQCLFEDYLHRLDRVFEHQKGRAVMFVDNCEAHSKVEKLKAIRLEFLPPNT